MGMVLPESDWNLLEACRLFSLKGWTEQQIAVKLRVPVCEVAEMLGSEHGRFMVGAFRRSVEIGKRLVVVEEAEPVEDYGLW